MLSSGHHKCKHFILVGQKRSILCTRHVFIAGKCRATTNIWRSVGDTREHSARACMIGIYLGKKNKRKRTVRDAACTIEHLKQLLQRATQIIFHLMVGVKHR
jgi:hypothetical protein